MPRVPFRMRVGSPRLIGVALAVPGCYLAYLLGTMLAPVRAPVAAAPAPQATAGLEADPASLAVGEVWEDPAFVREVVLTNRGDRPAHVTELSGGCECTRVEPRAFTVPPGGTQTVRVSIDLTHRFPYQFGAERRELALPLHATLADRGVAAGGWKITGVVKSRVSLDGRGLEFADLCGRGGPPVTRAMRATAHVPLAALTAAAPSDRATAEVRPVSGKPGEYAIRVTPNADLPLGPFRFTVPVSATLPDGRTVPCASFAVTGEVVSPVRVVPGPVLLGEVPVGSKAEAVVAVRFPAAGWSVDRVETERTDTTVAATDPLDGHPAYRITQAVGEAGDRSAQVRFVCRRPQGDVETVPVVVLWYGDSPAEKSR